MTRGGVEIQLTATEFELLRYLMRNPRRVLSKAQILDRVWNYDFGGQANVVELYISYLRKKIDADRRADDPHHARRGIRAAPGGLMAESPPGIVRRPERRAGAPSRRTPGAVRTRHPRSAAGHPGDGAGRPSPPILLSAAAALATRQLLIGQIDRQLDSVAPAPGRGPPGGRPRHRMRTGAARAADRHASLRPSPLDSDLQQSAILPEGGQRPGQPAGRTSSTELRALEPDDRQALGRSAGVGNYRIVVYSTEPLRGRHRRDGGRTAPWSGCRCMTSTSSLIELIGLERSSPCSRSAARCSPHGPSSTRSLRPLNRVAATAQQVSQLELDRGEVALAVRVPPRGRRSRLGGRPGRPGLQPHAQQRRGGAGRPPGQRGRRSASSSPTPRTSCATRWRRSAATPS